MQNYKKLFQFAFIALLFLILSACGGKSPALPKTPDLSEKQLNRVEVNREFASKRFRWKENRRAKRLGRKNERRLRRIAREEKQFRKRHFKRQTPKTQEMMLNSEKESEELRNRGKFWPRFKRNIQRKRKAKGELKWTE